jgi:DNA replication initiation complex subunit (GINS family)
MNKEILTYKRVLTLINVAQNVQTLYAVYKDIQPYVFKAPSIQPVFEIFGTELFVLADFINKSFKPYETEELVKLDAKRDFTVRSVIAKVQYHYDYAQTDGEKENARRLVYVTEKYKNVAQKEYESETAYLRSLINELQQTPDLLDTFDLTGLVAKLKQENDEFETLYNIRAQIVHDKQSKGNATKYRSIVNKAFDNVCRAITGLLLTPLSDEERSALESIVDIINGQIQQITVVYNRHAGVIAKKKNNEKDDDMETPEIDGDEETDIQK